MGVSLPLPRVLGKDLSTAAKSETIRRVRSALSSPRHILPALNLLVLCLGIAASTSVLGQSQDADPGIQFVNMEVPSVLRHYEAWTGKRIISDSAVNTATITILSNEPMSDADKAVFVEKSLLLNGYALIPSGPDLLKAVVVPGVSGQARSEGLEVFADPKDLPESDRLVAYVMKFEHIGAETAAAALTSVFPPHGYGTIVPFPQASSVVITDNSATIRRYLDLKPYIDVQRQDVPLSIRQFPLERGDATKVVEALNELLSLQSSSSSGSPAKSGGATPAAGAGAPAAAIAPGGGSNTYAQVAPVGRSGFQTLLQTESPDKARFPPKIRADPRTNQVLAVAEPKDMDYIQTLIGFLDSPAPERHFYTRQLNYLRVATLLDNLPNALQPGLESGSGSQATVAGGKGNETRTGMGNSTNGRSQYGNSLGNDPLMGSGSSLSSSSSSRRSSGLSGFEFNENPGPQSMVIDKTFVMADNVQNRLLATGPEEHLQLIDSLIEELDQKPKQIQISAVIAQVGLDDTITSGLDLLRRIEDVNHLNGLAGSLRAPGSILSATTLLGATSAVNPAIGQGLTLYGRLNPSLNGALSLIQQLDRVKILARPTVYTQNDRKAVIKTGERIAIPTSTYTPYTGTTTGIASSVSYEDVVLQIEVLPLINSDDQVTLNIIQVNDDIGKRPTTIGGNEIPSITTQELATTVVVPDGGTVLLGGLIKEEERPSRSGLPHFVALPLVGPLFGSNKNPKGRSELMVFIQPRIVEDALDLAQAQGDVQARAKSSPEVMEFAAPPIRSEAVPVRQTLLNRLFPKKPRQSQPEPTTNPADPAPILNRRGNLP